MHTIYRLSDGRLWDCQQAKWIDETQAASLDETGYEITDLINADGPANVQSLVASLKVYGYPLGELALLSVSGIKELLARLDEEYLTPRTLAGLSANDPEALERWREHEEKARPLRERLQELGGEE